MRIIIIGLCTVIIILTAHNFYLQEDLKEVFRGQKYDYKMLETFSQQLYELRQNDSEK